MAGAPAKPGGVTAADDFPSAIAFPGREHDVSPPPVHLGLSITKAHHRGVLMHMEKQLDLVAARALKAVLDGDSSICMFKTYVAPVDNGVLQARIAVVFSRDENLFGILLEPQQTRIRL